MKSSTRSRCAKVNSHTKTKNNAARPPDALFRVCGPQVEQPSHINCVGFANILLRASCFTQNVYCLMQLARYTNCVKLLRFVYLAPTGGSLKRSLGMARCSLCKAQHLITIGVT